MKTGDKIVCIKTTVDFKYNKIYTIAAIFKSMSHGELYINSCEVRYKDKLYIMDNKTLYENFISLIEMRKEKLKKLKEQSI
jgi:hypothetical protein